MNKTRYKRADSKKLFRGGRCAYCACGCGSCSAGRHCRNSFNGCMIPTYIDKL